MYDETTIQPAYDHTELHAAQPAPAEPILTVPAVDNGPRNRSLLIAGAAAIVLLAILAGLLLTMRGGDVTLTNSKGKPVAAGNAGSTDLGTAPADEPTTAEADTSTTEADTSTTTAGVDITTKAPAAKGQPATNGANSAPAGNGTPTGGQTKPHGPAPVINSFTAPDSIDCHNGNFQQFTLSWSTTNAAKVTIAIDGPGIYKTYPATASDDMPFTCPGPHTFTIVAHGHDGKTATKTITLKGRNVQTPTKDEDDTPKTPATKPEKAPIGGTADTTKK